MLTPALEALWNILKRVNEPYDVEFSPIYCLVAAVHEQALTQNATGLRIDLTLSPPKDTPVSQLETLRSTINSLILETIDPEHSRNETNVAGPALLVTYSSEPDYPVIYVPESQIVKFQTMVLALYNHQGCVEMSREHDLWKFESDKVSVQAKLQMPSEDPSASWIVEFQYE